MIETEEVAAATEPPVRPYSVAAALKVANQSPGAGVYATTLSYVSTIRAKVTDLADARLVRHFD